MGSRRVSGSVGSWNGRRRHRFRGSRDHGRDPANRGACMMTLLPRGVKVHLAFGFTEMRKGIDGLAMLVHNAIRYALWRWEGLTRFIDDRRIELDNNTIERSIRRSRST